MGRKEKKNQENRFDRVYQLLSDYYGSHQELHRESPTIAGETVLDSLVATMLTQATTDRTAIKAFRELKRLYPSWTAVMDHPESQLAQTIAVSGLANQKAKHIREMLEKVHAMFGKYTLEPLRQMDPNDVRKILISLPGVGSKTAACVQAFVLGQDAFPVDTHVHRILYRLGWTNSKATAVQVQTLMEKTIPSAIQSALHIYLINHGRSICKARKPLCLTCPIREICQKQGI